jgi:hypothetical protein
MEIDKSDLEFIKDALNTAKFKSMSEDMTESYRQMDVRGKTSPLTKHLEQAYERAYDLLEAERQREKEEEDVSE